MHEMEWRVAVATCWSEGDFPLFPLVSAAAVLGVGRASGLFAKKRLLIAEQIFSSLSTGPTLRAQGPAQSQSPLAPTSFP